MKKIILAFVLCLTAAYSHAQLRGNTKFFFVRIITFPNFDYDWYTEELRLDSNNSNGDHFRIFAFENFNNSRDTYFVRQKDQIVYHYNDTLYNFKLGQNDSFSMSWFGAPKHFKVHSGGSVNVAGKSLNVLYLANGQDSTKWVEGIGDDQLGILYPLKRYIDAGYILKAVCRNDTLLWWNELGSDYFGPADPDTTCDFASLAQMVSVPSLNLKARIAIYPNPFTSHFSIKTETAMTFTLLDLSGRIIRSGELDAGLNEMACSNLEPGVYFIGLYDGNAYYYQKLILKGD